MQGTRESKENQKEDEETGNEQQDDTKAGAVHNENTKSGVNLGVNFSISTGFGWVSEFCECCKSGSSTWEICTSTDPPNTQGGPRSVALHSQLQGVANTNPP